VSGGQTGADRGGLEAAIYCHVPHGGWCPKGRKAEDGVIPPAYQLTERPSADYMARTKANVVDSDATIIFTDGPLSGGSSKTAAYARHLKKPFYVVDLNRTNHKKTIDAIVRWLNGEATLNHDGNDNARPPLVCVLNVAGSRESQVPGMQETVFQLMVEVLLRVNPIL